MTISKVSTLVSSAWLRKKVLPTSGKLNSSIRVLDAAWNPSPNADTYHLYKEEHIPTALHFDLQEVSTPRKNSFDRNPIPEPKHFKQYLQELGICNHTHVVIYDAMMYRPSFRAWFLFRLFGHDNISVLNGGLQHWKAEGHPTTAEVPKVKPGDFEPKFRRHLLQDFSSMVDNVKSGSAQVMDARAASSFQGGDAGGHIPGSVNIPFNEFITDNGLFKDNKELKKLFDDANIDLHKPLIATCQTAMTACTATAAAHILGKYDVSVYNGSWMEWVMRADQDLINNSTNKE